MTRILVTNVHSMLNAGDAALALETVRRLRESFPASGITLSMDHPEPGFGGAEVTGSLFSWVTAVSKDGRPTWRKWNLFLLPAATLIPFLSYRLFRKPLFLLTPAPVRLILAPYFTADLVVSKPGGFFYTSGRGVTFLVAIHALFLAWLARKPFYIFPQSIGPFKRGWERTLFRWMMNKARVITLREPISLEIARSLGCRQPCLMPDQAFSFPAAPASLAFQWLSQHGVEPANKTPLLGMTVINWNEQSRTFAGQSAYLQACEKAARWFVDHTGGKVILFTQVRGPYRFSDDRIATRALYSRLADLSASVLLADEPIAPDLLKALYGCMDLFIGTRMHSNIFALSAGTPVVAIAYRHKTRGIMRMLGLEEWVMDIDQASGDAVAGRLALLWERKDEVRQQMMAKVTELSEGTARVAQMAAGDFSTYERQRTARKGR